MKVYNKCFEMIVYIRNLLAKIAWFCINGERLREKGELPSEKGVKCFLIPKYYPFCSYINETFLGCDQHHIDDNTIICIPTELHKQVYHNRKNGIGMEIINEKAIRWVKKHPNPIAQQPF